jgi:hypothetical protein
MPFRPCRLYGSQYAPAELCVIRPEPPDLPVLQDSIAEAHPRTDRDS